MSAARLEPDHPDYEAVSALVENILAAAGGIEQFSIDVPALFRKAIDEVIDAPRTNRFTLAETEKTEKTYLGTKVEILLRDHLGFSRGEILDLNINGIECDIKNSMGSNWSIPAENIGRAAILMKQDELKARCSFGVAVLHAAYLNPGMNQDGKRTLAAAHFSNVWWILRDHPYPENFWIRLPISKRDEIQSAGSASARVAKLFYLVRETPISRLHVQAVARQHDPMRRIRRGGGARDILAPLGIAILWGQGDFDLIAKLGLGSVSADEFISFEPRNSDEIAMLRDANHID